MESGVLNCWRAMGAWGKGWGILPSVGVRNREDVNLVQLVLVFGEVLVSGCDYGAEHPTINLTRSGGEQARFVVASGCHKLEIGLVMRN